MLIIMLICTSQGTESVSLLKTIQVLMFSEINIVEGESGMKHIDMLLGQSAEFWNSVVGDTYNYDWALSGARW
jgi:hypothetical protein